MTTRTRGLLAVLLGVALAMVAVLGAAPRVAMADIIDGLYVGGARVNTSETDSGDGWSFTPADHQTDTPATLTLSGATITEGYNDGDYTYGIAYGGTQPLEICLAPDTTNSISVNGNAYGIGCPYASLSISGGGSLDMAGGTYGIYAQQVSVTDGTVNATGGYIGVSAGNIGIMEGASVTARGDIFAVMGNVQNAVAGAGWTDAEGTQGEAAINAVDLEGSSSHDMEELHKFCRVQFPAPYPLWVGGVRVSPANASNITGGDTVTASYDAESKTLTLNGYIFDGTQGDTQTQYGIDYEGDTELVINLAGENSVKATTAGIYSQIAGVAIGGKGSIDASGVSYGINAPGVTISGGSVTSEGTGGQDDYPIGILANANLTVKGGTVNASGASYGIQSQGITIEGGEVTATGAATSGGSVGIAALGGAMVVSGGKLSATGSKNGVRCYTFSDADADLAVTGGTVVATATGAEGYGVVTIEKGLFVGDGVASFTASGAGGAWSKGEDPEEFDVLVRNAVPGAGWSDAKGTKGKTKIAKNADPGQDLSVYKMVKFPEEVTEFTVKLKGGANASATGGTTEQAVSEGEAMATVTYAAKDGYHFESYAGETKSGVTAKLEGGKVVVSGKPTANVEITVPDAVKDATPTPEVVPDASVTAHVQRIGWMDPVTDGTAAGTTGKSRRMEALALKLPEGVSGGIEYRGHVQRSGWEKTWAADGNVAGTTGKSRRVEAVQIQLTGEAKDAYDVYYRVHVQRYGWMGWAKNGEQAGTQGMSRRAEAIQVVLVKKDAPAPDSTYKGVTQQYAKAFVKK